MRNYTSLEHILQHNRREAHNMATSSFSKTFVFKPEATKKVQTVQQQPGFKVPSYATGRMKEGKEALTRFSFPSKK